jgi:hypothetical protein
VLQAKARLNYCFLFKITLLWQLRFISKSEKEPNYSQYVCPKDFTIDSIINTVLEPATHFIR